MRAVRLSPFVGVLSLALLVVAGVPAAAQSTAVTASADAPRRAATDADHVAEASHRFGVPEHWIWAVMRVESNGNAGAVSSAGAMGLMQIMPDTWTYLRARYRLGNDPFDRRANILGGTAYLREMHDRFGAPGFLAAYNAGPGRYAEYLSRGRSLPSETRTYLARLAPMVGTSAPARAVAPPLPDRRAWTRAALFPERPSDRVADDRPAVKTTNATRSPQRDVPTDESRETLFIALSGRLPR